MDIKNKRFNEYEKHFKLSNTGCITYKNLALFEKNSKYKRYYKYEKDLEEYDFYEVVLIDLNIDKFINMLKIKNRILSISVNNEKYIISYLTGISTKSNKIFT